MKFQIRYKEPNTQYEDILEDSARRILSNSFKDVNAVIDYMKDGTPVNTMFAHIRLVVE